MITHNIFPTKMYEDTIDVEGLEGIITSIAKNTPTVSVSNVKGYQSKNLFHDENMQNVIKDINEIALLVKNFLGVGDGLLTVSQLWVNVNTKGSYNRSHIHPGAFLSGCLYVKANDDTGVISFTDPRIGLRMHEMSFQTIPFNEPHNMVSYEITPKEGKIIFFPAWLTHEVLSNESDEDRMSISFNMRFVQ